MSSQITYEETLSDYRAAVSSTATYPDFELTILENDGGVYFRLTAPNPKRDPDGPILVAISPEQAQQIIKALQDAIKLTSR
jgi:hypothetical protein